MIAIIDYGAGNLQSVQKALSFIGAESVITSDKKEISAADGVILPGVGSFGDSMNSLIKRGLPEIIREAAASGVPFLGICLGLQLLFDGSEESPGADGLGILRGRIKKIPGGDGLKVPHMGWNSLELAKKDGIFRGVEDNAYVYFVHSYYLTAENQSEVAAKTVYGVAIDAAVEKGNIHATQFHPEKSGSVGLQILKNFVAETGGNI